MVIFPSGILFGVGEGLGVFGFFILCVVGDGVFFCFVFFFSLILQSER